MWKRTVAALALLTHTFFWKYAELRMNALSPVKNFCVRKNYLRVNLLSAGLSISSQNSSALGSMPMGAWYNLPGLFSIFNIHKEGQTRRP